MNSTSYDSFGARIHNLTLPVVVLTAVLAMFVLASMGIWLTRETGRIASIWMANAAILSLMLISAGERHPHILSAAYLGNVLANLIAGDSLGIALVLSACNSLEIAIVTFLLLRFSRRIDFTVLRDLMRFAVVAGFIAPLLTASAAASWLYFAVDASFTGVLVNWYASDALGLLVFLPLLATILGHKTSHRDLHALLKPKTTLLMVVNLATASAIFWQDSLPLLFLVIPPLMLVAAKSGTTGAVVANLFVTAIAIAGTLHARGPIVLIDASLAMQMALLQLFLATCVFTSLLVSAYLAEQKRLEGSLRRAVELSEQANAAKRVFLSTVSHELRTPLTSIRGSLGLVQAGMGGDLPAKAKNLIRIAHANSERLVRLINDILDMEKIESGKMDFDIQQHDLRAVIEPALEAANAYLPEKKVRIVLVDDAPGTIIPVDAGRIQQVMGNLLSNAIKFSPSEGIVKVRLSLAGQQAMISVADEGPGIPEAFRSRIFSKFEQADSSNTRTKGGTGLGLSISKALVNHMSGNVTFQSEEGAGTTFTVEFPTSGSMEPTLILGADSLPRVLVCTKDSETASQAARLLGSDSYITDHAPDVPSACLLLNERPYTALVLDIDLSENFGLRRLGELREEYAHREVPIIALASSAEEAEATLGSAATCNLNWIAKPVDPEDLLSTLRKTRDSIRDDRPSVLHVENDWDVLQVMAESLGSSVATSFARSVADARLKLARDRFDLVILDLSMPDGSGLDLLAQVDADTPVIIFSAVEIGSRSADRVQVAATKTRQSEADVARSVHLLLANKPGRRRAS